MQIETAPPAFRISIDTDELRVRLASSAPPVVAEILGPQHFSTGHLPAAVNLPLEGFGESAARVLPNKDEEVVVYCASEACQNSDLAERELRALGYSKVRVYRGGKAAWKAAGLSLET